MTMEEQVQEEEEQQQQQQQQQQTTQEQPETIYSLPILPYICKKRAAHGITAQHSDHKRYRVYLSRRLNKLRERTDSKHGRGGKFNKQNLIAKVQKPLNEWKFEPKKIDFVELLLLQAERAWSYGTELKLQNMERDDSRVRIHSMKKFKKAFHYAKELQDISKWIPLDKSTLVEIMAYFYASKAQHELECERWEAALRDFHAAKTIYSELGNVCSIGTEKDLYRNRCDELETSIRFCRYNLEDSDKNAQNLQELELNAWDNNISIAKINEVLQEKRREMAVSKTQIQLDGRTIPVEQEKMRVLLVKIDHLESQVNEITSGGNSFESKHFKFFDQLVFSYMELEKSIQNELQKSEIQSSAGATENLKLLSQWTNRKLVDVFVKRNVWSARNILGEKQSNLIENKNLKPYDLVKVFDSTLHRMRDSEVFASSASYSILYFRVLRVLFLALAYYKRSREAECQLLLNRAQELVKQLEKMKNNDSENLCLHLLPKLETIQNELRKLNVTVRAQYAQKVLNLSSSTTTEVSETVSYQVTQFPPAFESIVCKPIFFDIAGNGIEYPELSSKLKEERKEELKTTTQEEPRKKGWFSFW